MIRTHSHHALHNARPDVVAACHSHSTYGKAFAALGKEIEMISQDSCLFWCDCPPLQELQ